MIITCPRCKKANRLPRVPNAKIRCGDSACAHLFTPQELTKAHHEAPKPFVLDVEDDEEQEEPDDE